MHTGVEAELAQYPTPQELWECTFATRKVWRDRFSAVPFEDRGGFFQSRYYQRPRTMARSASNTCVTFRITKRPSRPHRKSFRPGSRNTCIKKLREQVELPGLFLST